MKKYYAGIGSRQTPQHILSLMELIAYKLNHMGYTLRSGGARGADRAFESHARLKEIYTAYDATSEAISLVSKFHPAWEKCIPYAQKLHGRNAMIILGKNMDQPVSFVICWTKDGNAIGGTGTGIRIAEAYNIPVFNLQKEEHFNRLFKFVQSVL